MASRSQLAWIILGVLLFASIGSGVAYMLLSGDDDPGEREPAFEGYTPVWERSLLPYETNDTWGHVLEDGPYELLETSNEWNSEHAFVPVPLPTAEGGAAVDPGCVSGFDPTRCPHASLAFWRPDVPADVKVPVIVEMGPYFNEPSVGTGPIETPGTWLGQNIINEHLPHGFAFAQVSVMGTGDSNHCMDLMGWAEQLGVDAAVTWLGEQDWSNGNIGIIGKSYDGSVQWQAAQFGNPHLKTIVPISGLIGVRELMWKNGSTEARAPFMHNVVYGSYGIDGDTSDVQNACPDYIAGPIHGTNGYIFGGEEFQNSIIEGYWEERYFLPDVLANYNGSVYIVQGLHDWNVDPHMAIPTLNQLKDAGITAKAFLGQWDHDYPDRPDYMKQRSDPGRGSEAYPEMVRFDWMQDLLEWFTFYLKEEREPLQQVLLEWFTFYLKEEGYEPNHWTEVQDNQGNWRVEDRYPADDSTDVTFDLGSMTQTQGGNQVFPGSAALVFETEPFEEEFRFGGLPTFHVSVTPEGNGGQLYALLEDCDGGDCIHVGHAVMDLRYHAGGTTYDPAIAGSTIVAMMEFFAMDIVIFEGHHLQLRIMATGDDYLPSATSNPVAVHIDDSSVLTLPEINIDEKTYFEVPECTFADCLS